MEKNPRDSKGGNPPLRQPPTQNLFKVWMVCCFLLLAVLLVFGQTIQHEFIVCDDNVYIYSNSHVVGGITRDNVEWSLTSCYYAGNWHPLTWLSHILDAQLYGIHDLHPDGIHKPEPWKGPEAGGHHLTSVLLHAASAIVLFLALRRMTGAFWSSAFVAAMFALHPLRAESVAWAAERKDVLSGLFWMLTLLAYAAYALRPSIGRYLAVVGVFALGLTAKSMLVTLPCVLLLLDFWPLGRWQPKAICQTPTKQTPSRFSPRSLGWLVAEKVPLLALSAIVCWIVAVSQQNLGAMSMVDNVPLGSRFANAAVSGVAYLWMMTWPFNLAIFYPHPSVLGGEAASWLIWQGVAAGLLLAAITLFVLWNLRRRPYLAVGWFWYLGSLVPVIGLIQVGAQARADRYTYLPMIGVSIMVVWGAAKLAARSSRLRATIGVAAGVLLATWTVLAFNQVATWKNSFTVFQHAIRVTSNNYFAHNHLGLAYQYADKNQEAGDEYAEAVRIAPSYDAANANLGAYYFNSNQLDKAEDCFREACRVNPFLSGHKINLGSVYFKRGKLDEAKAVFRQIIQINPEDLNNRRNLIRALCLQGKYSESLVEMRELLCLSPNAVDILNEIAWIRATSPDESLRDGKRAVELAQQAVELTKGEDPLTLDVLAAAYAETGRFPLAVETANKAAKLAMQKNKPVLAKSIRVRIPNYEVGKPYREAPPVFKGAPPSP